MRVLTVVGARPQFVKAGPVSKALRARHEEILVHTGQHYDETLSAAFFRDLGLPEPDANLGVGSGEPGPRLAAMIRGLRGEIRRTAPDCALVYGDTDSTLAGALAARDARVPLVHVEAGLRSGRMDMPEEINRIATDHLSALLLCPTERAAVTLEAEAAAGQVVRAGDVMLDASLAHREAARALDVPGSLGLAPGGYYVATVHREFTVEDVSRLEGVVRALAQLDRPVVFPCHPRTRTALASIGLGDGDAQLRMVEPLGYLAFLGLVAASGGVLTDSGGLQKEALFLGVPCVTLRRETEWPETLAGDWNVLAGTGTPTIVAAVGRIGRERDPPPVGAFGDGHAAAAVVNAMESAFA